MAGTGAPGATGVTAVKFDELEHLKARLQLVEASLNLSITDDRPTDDQTADANAKSAEASSKIPVPSSSLSPKAPVTADVASSESAELILV